MTYEEFCEIVRAGIASGAVLDAETKLGELMSRVPKKQGFASAIRDSGVANVETKTEIIEEVKTTAELTDLDLAIQYAIGQEMQERGGGELQTTAEEIYFLIGKHCGEAVQSRVFSN